jgi:hypothetical protein
MRESLRLRARLVPYIATAQRTAFETGVQVVRPLYYAFPECPSAYTPQALHQYNFGPAIMAAPIAQPAAADGSTGGMVAQSVWLPPGAWVEWWSYALLVSPGPDGVNVTRNYSLAETPVFSPAGAIIPLRTLPEQGGSLLGLASQVPGAITMMVLPGVSPSPGGSVTTSTTLYDDDGLSVAYLEGAYYWTTVNCTWVKAASPAGADSVACTVSPPAGGGFAGFPSERTYRWAFPGTYPPATVTVNGAPAAFDRQAVPDAWGDNGAWMPDQDAWAWHGETLTTWVNVGEPAPTAAPLTVAVTFPAGYRLDDPLLTSGAPRKIARAQAAKDVLDPLWGFVFSADVPGITNASAAGLLAQAASPGSVSTIAALLSGLDNQLATGAAQLTALGLASDPLVATPVAAALAYLADGLSLAA